MPAQPTLALRDLKAGDVLFARRKSTRGEIVMHFKVVKVNRSTVTVVTPQGYTIRAYIGAFDGKVPAGEPHPWAEPSQ